MLIVNGVRSLTPNTQNDVNLSRSLQALWYEDVDLIETEESPLGAREEHDNRR
jgi:hypothetical protein